MPHAPSRRGASRVLLTLVAASLVVVATATGAAAHVRVTSTDANQGGYAVLTFRVPTESATASTTQLAVTFPKDHPITSVSTQPVPGWTATVDTDKLAKPIKTDDGEVTDYVTKVTWKADSAASAIKPGEFQQFDVSAGPLPDVASVSFPSLQTYSDGTTVNWNEQSADGSTEPEHPAPTLELAAASPQQEAAADKPSATAKSGTVVDANGSSGSPSWPGWTGLVLGVIAVLLAAGALVRGGRRTPTG